jgi:hypothetical protein
MTISTVERTESHLYPAEEKVPFYDWLDAFMKLAQRLEREHPLKFSVKGTKYAHVDYWRALAYKCLTLQPVKAAVDELDKLLAARAPAGGAGQRPLGGTYPRHDRLVPHVTQVNTFLKKLPKAFKAKMVEEIFHAFCTVALELGLISKTITVYIDYTNKWFYGLVDPDHPDPCITGTNKGPGTKWTRKYGAFMLSSGTTRLFAGLFLSRKGYSRAPDVLHGLELLRRWGFEVEHVEGDREFTCYDLLAALGARGKKYLGSIKHTPGVKKAIKAYLAGKRKAVTPFALNPSQFTTYQVGPVPCYLILKPDRGTRLRDLQKQLASGTLTEADAMEHVHAFVTTLHPPRQRRRLVHWGLGLLNKFSKRWRIETGFRDLNRMLPASHARNHATKTIMFAFQMFAYNCWQLQRALHRRLRHVPKVWREGPTLERFAKRVEDQVRIGACAK